MKLPSLRESESEIRVLSHSQVAALREAIHPRFRVAVSLGAYAGLRAGEVFGLQVQSLDMLRRRLAVRPRSPTSTVESAWDRLKPRPAAAQWVYHRRSWTR